MGFAVTSGWAVARKALNSSPAKKFVTDCPLSHSSVSASRASICFGL